MKKTSEIIAAALIAVLILPATIFAKNNSDEKEKNKKNYELEKLEKKELKKEYKEKIDDLKKDLEAKIKNLNKAEKNFKSLTGNVVSVSGNIISFNSNGTAYIIDASSAKITSEYGVKMQPAGIQAGDKIKVYGKIDSNSANNISAITIRDLSEETAYIRTGGKVIAISGTSFNLRINKKKSRMINTDSSTIITKNGQPAQFSNITVGSTVKVTGIWDKAANTIAAQNVNVVVKIAHISFFGKLAAKTNNSLIVNRSENSDNASSYTVDVSRAVIVFKYNGKAKVSDLNIGDKLQVKGKHEIGSASVTAYLVKDYSIPMPGATPNPTPSLSPSVSPPPTPSLTPSPTASPSPSPTPSPSPSPSPTPTPTP